MPNQPPPTGSTNPLWDLTQCEALSRRELGRRIHDDIVQVAYAARIKLDQLHLRTPRNETGGPGDDSLRDLLDHIRRSALEMCYELRAHDVRRALEQWARETRRRIGISGQPEAARHEAISTCAYRAVIELIRELDPERARVRLLAGPRTFSVVLRAHGCGQPLLSGPAVAACLTIGATIAKRARPDGCLIALELPDAAA